MLNELLDALHAESEDLDRMVCDLDQVGWATRTPAEGWTIAHQISHLAWTDDWAYTSVVDPEQFRGRLQAAPEDDLEAGAAAGIGDRALLHRWRGGRDRLRHALSCAPADARLPWFGPPMKLPSMITARIMETWAHGQDVADALHLEREPTARLRHIAHLGVRTMAFAFSINGLPKPEAPVRIELLAPDGDEWTWGPEEAADRVRGPVLDFCLLVAQRRHRGDLAITAVGPTARTWLTIAQAFAGPPGPGRAPGKAPSRP